MLGHLLKSFTPVTCFSSSALWEIITQNYQESGEGAWDRNIPYAVTNSTLTAKYHAQLIFQHAQSTRYQKHQYGVIDYGAGVGQHAYYLAKSLQDICTAHNHPIDHFVIYLADISNKCLAHWRQHPQLAPLIEQGVLRPLSLSGDWLQDASMISNLPHRQHCVIANYLLDSMPFHAYEYGLKQGISLSAPRKHLSPCFSGPLSSLTLKTAILNPQPPTDKIEKSLQQRYHNIPRFTIPKTAIECINQLLTHCPDLLTIINDKGYVTPEEIEYDEVFNLAFEGSFSTSVNFDAIKHCLPPSVHFAVHGDSPRLKTVVISHTPLAPLSSPTCADTTSLYHLMKGQSNLNLSMCDSICKILNYDPYCLELISQALTESPTPISESFKKALMEINNNHFSKRQDYHLLHLARIMRKTHHYDKCLMHLESYARKNRPESENGAYHLEHGIFLLMTNQSEQAQQSLILAKSDTLTKKTAEDLLQKLQRTATSNEY